MRRLFACLSFLFFASAAKFKPTATGTRTASLSVADNASGSPQTCKLTGTGQ